MHHLKYKRFCHIIDLEISKEELLFIHSKPLTKWQKYGNINCIFVCSPYDFQKKANPNIIIDILDHIM